VGFPFFAVVSTQEEGSAYFVVILRGGAMESALPFPALLSYGLNVIEWRVPDPAGITNDIRNTRSRRIKGRTS